MQMPGQESKDAPGGVGRKNSKEQPPASLVPVPMFFSISLILLRTRHNGCSSRNLSTHLLPRFFVCCWYRHDLLKHCKMR